MNHAYKNWRHHTLPASTNPKIAQKLCQSANLNTQDILFDPFCGCGTIPITAVLDYNIKQAFASDVSGRAVDCAEKNRSLAKIPENRIVIFRSNVSLIKLIPHSIDKIITNLPFGIRTGNHKNNIKIYQNFCRKALTLLKNTGTGIILTQEKKLFQQIFSLYFDITKIETIELSGLSPDIYQIKPKKILI